MAYQKCCSLEKAICAVREKAEHLVNCCCLPGLAVGMTLCDDIILCDGFGIRNEKGDCVTPETVFQISHASEAWVSAFFGKMATDNQICFDTRVDTFCALPLQGPCACYATVRDVLSHRTGIETVLEHQVRQLQNYSSQDIIDAHRHAEWSEEGSVHRANMNYAFVDQLQRCACDSLKLHPCNIWPSYGLTYLQGKCEFDAACNRALPMVRDCGKWMSKYEHAADTLPIAYGAATNLKSFLQFMLMFNNAGVLNCQQFMAPEAIREMRQPLTPIFDYRCNVIDTGTATRTMGWIHFCYACFDVLLVQGFSEAGLRTVAVWVPARRFSFVALSNSFNSHVIALAAFAIWAVLHCDIERACLEYKRILKWDIDFIRSIVCCDPKCCPPCDPGCYDKPLDPSGFWCNDRYGDICIEWAVYDERGDKCRSKIKCSQPCYKKCCKPKRYGCEKSCCRDKYDPCKKKTKRKWNIAVTFGKLAPAIGYYQGYNVWQVKFCDAFGMPRRAYVSAQQGACFKVIGINAELFCLSINYERCIDTIQGPCLENCPPRRCKCKGKGKEKSCYHPCYGIDRKEDCDDLCGNDYDDCCKGCMEPSDKCICQYNRSHQHDQQTQSSNYVNVEADSWQIDYASPQDIYPANNNHGHNDNWQIGSGHSAGSYHSQMCNKCNQEQRYCQCIKICRKCNQDKRYCQCIKICRKCNQYDCRCMKICRKCNQYDCRCQDTCNKCQQYKNKCQCARMLCNMCRGNKQYCKCHEK